MTFVSPLQTLSFLSQLLWAMKIRVLTLGCLFLWHSATLVAGDADWPQWRGPERDGHAAPQSLLEEWPEDGPPLKWGYDNAGRGYSAVAVVDGRLFTLGARDGECLAICLDTHSGDQVWEQTVSRAGTEEDYLHGWGGGPRSTPTVDGDQVFVLSEVGVLAALDRDSGKIQWSTNLVDDHGGSIPKWGYSESPLVDGDRVVVTPGGTNFMVAVDRSSGEKIWSSQGVDEPAEYSSVVRGRVGSTSFYVTAHASGLVALDTESGEKLFDEPATGNDVAVIPTPIVHDNLIYHTSDYGAGNVLLKLSETDEGGITAEPVYQLSNNKTMRNHHGGVVLVDGVIYGFTRPSGGNWMAQDLASGETLWQERVRPNRSGSICYADGRLYCYNDEDGTVILAAPSREGWQPKGKLELPRETELARNKGAIWAHPVVADKTLIIRDQDLIFAFDIAAE